MTDRNSETITVDGHEIELSNLDKILFPDSGITKGDLVDYYRRIAPVALPHWRGRPLSMHRFPDGIGADGFFQKEVPGYFPDWIDRIELPKQDGTVTYAVADKAATLVYLANQGCITPHLSLARRDKPDHPDRLIFDLDPSDDDFAKIQRAAKRVRALLDDLDMASFVQTSGSRGLHVVVPLDRSADFDEARAFARDAAESLAERYPQELTVEQRKDKRGDRVFLDYLRNAYGQTSVAPYAVRAIEGAPVATPLRWSEAGAGDLDPRKYTLRNIFRRLSRIDDPWEQLPRRRYSISAAAKRLATLS
ncbi:MAG: non-homologous end-joining DNA ligase [Bauldia litoralis]